MKIRFTAKFRQRLDEIAVYIYQQSKSKKLTYNYISKLKKHLNASLTMFPQLGRPANEFGKGIRKLVHQNYTILYKIEDDYILVITIYRENLPSL